MSRYSTIGGMNDYQVLTENYQTTTLRGVEFRLPSYYKIIKFLGAGSYGCVVQAQDLRQNGKLVAIKKMSQLMSNLQDSKRCLREIALMQMLNHENIASLVDFIIPENLNDLSVLYIVLAFKETDLHKIISSKQQLTTEHIQYFMYQIFRGLVFIHSAGILHRDLKPSNLLLDSDCGLQICDFGLARLSAERSEQQNQQMTEYVSTRYYRSPEILLNSHTYSFNVDVFAAGCILAELINRRPLFPGRDYINQLNLEIQVLGKPTKEYISRIQNPSAKQYVQQLPDNHPVDLKRICPNGTPQALDLLKKCLEFDDRKRITALEAMKHPFFQDLYDPEDVILYTGKPITLFFEKYPLTKQLLELGFLNCCAKFHKEIQPEVDRRMKMQGLTSDQQVELIQNIRDTYSVQSNIKVIKNLVLLPKQNRTIILTKAANECQIPSETVLQWFEYTFLKFQNNQNFDTFKQPILEHMLDLVPQYYNSEQHRSITTFMKQELMQFALEHQIHPGKLYNYIFNICNKIKNQEMNSAIKIIKLELQLVKNVNQREFDQDFQLNVKRACQNSIMVKRGQLENERDRSRKNHFRSTIVIKLKLTLNLKLLRLQLASLDFQFFHFLLEFQQLQLQNLLKNAQK